MLWFFFQQTESCSQCDELCAILDWVIFKSCKAPPHYSRTTDLQCSATYLVEISLAAKNRNKLIFWGKQFQMLYRMLYVLFVATFGGGNTLILQNKQLSNKDSYEHPADNHGAVILFTNVFAKVIVFVVQLLTSFCYWYFWEESSLLFCWIAVFRGGPRLKVVTVLYAAFLEFSQINSPQKKTDNFFRRCYFSCRTAHVNRCQHRPPGQTPLPSPSQKI